MSITWYTLGFDESLMVTALISPMTLTCIQSNFTMWTIDFWGKIFNFAHTVFSIILDEAPESTKKLWKLLLKTSKVKIKGRVWELHLTPIN